MKTPQIVARTGRDRAARSAVRLSALLFGMGALHFVSPAPTIDRQGPTASARPFTPSPAAVTMAYGRVCRCPGRQPRGPGAGRSRGGRQEGCRGRLRPARGFNAGRGAFRPATSHVLEFSPRSFASPDAPATRRAAELSLEAALPPFSSPGVRRPALGSSPVTRPVSVVWGAPVSPFL